ADGHVQEADRRAARDAALKEPTMAEAIAAVVQYWPPIAFVITAAGAAWAIWQYQTTAWIEARRPFLQKQFEFAIEAVQAAAQLSTTTDREIFERAKVVFWELYWGRLAIVEDDKLEAAMVNFGEALPRYGADSGNRGELLELSLDVAHATRT